MDSFTGVLVQVLLWDGTENLGTDCSNEMTFDLAHPSFICQNAHTSRDSISLLSCFFTAVAVLDR